MKTIVLVILALFIRGLHQKEIRVNSLSMQSLVIDSLFVKDIEIAAGMTYNSVLVVSDTIVIAQDISIQGISLTIICNELVMEGKTITISPNRIGEAEYNKEKHGLHGVLVRIYTRSAVHGTFVLPGGNGHRGEPGGPGKSGSSEFPARQKIAVHQGSPGKNGEYGGNGGNGGHLTIFTTQNGSTVILKSKPGEGARGGEGGPGGYTFDKRPREPENEPVRSTVVSIQERKGLNGKNGDRGVAGNRSVAKVEEGSLLAQIKDYGFTGFEFDSAGFTVRFIKRVRGNKFHFGPQVPTNQGQEVN